MDRWDKRFMEMARLVAGWSKDPSTKCGAVIVRPDRSIVSYGFNDFPSKLSEDMGHVWENREAKYEQVIHAEVQAIIHAREPLEGYTIYIQPFAPCSRCVGAILEAGIGKVVFNGTGIPDRWEKSAMVGMDMMCAAGVEMLFVSEG